jgi:MFS family permease
MFAFTVFFPPAVLLAVIQPASVKRDLDKLEKAGTVYGTLGAWNAAGSILGTYLAGFVFQAYFSTRLVWFVVAALLIVCGIYIYVRHRLSC